MCVTADNQAWMLISNVLLLSVKVQALCLRLGNASGTGKLSRNGPEPGSLRGRGCLKQPSNPETCGQLTGFGSGQSLNAYQGDDVGWAWTVRGQHCQDVANCFGNE
jgi:hypothetical protein